MSRKFVSQMNTPVEKSAKFRTPTNAGQLNEFMNQNEQQLPIGSIQGRQIRSNMIHQVSPLYPYKPSGNWATDTNYKGWNQDDLNTYIIRQSDKNTIKDFDRFVLKTDNEAQVEDIDFDPNKENNAPETVPKSLGYMIRDRIGKHRDNSDHIKGSIHRQYINGNANMNPMQTSIKLEKRKSGFF